jgi:hypothetical protein
LSAPQGGGADSFGGRSSCWHRIAGSPHLCRQGWSRNNPRTAPPRYFFCLGSCSSLHCTGAAVAAATAALAAALGSAACESTSAIIAIAAAFSVSVVAASAVVDVAGHILWHWSEACASLPRQLSSASQVPSSAH